jgi:hypothetical protein
MKIEALQFPSSNNLKDLMMTILVATCSVTHDVEKLSN